MFNLGQQPKLGDNQNQSLNQTLGQTDFNQTLNQPSFDQIPNQTLGQTDLDQTLTQPTQKGLFQIPERYLQLIPLLPFVLEMLTGQKIPPIGVMADILNGVQSLQGSLTRVINNQNQL